MLQSKRIRTQMKKHKLSIGYNIVIKLILPYTHKDKQSLPKPHV